MYVPVAVFDDVFQRGIDRGLFSDDTPIWIARDLFYGTLEYSARTILLRGEDRPTGVVDNMVAVFRARFGVQTGTQAAEPSNITLTRRLENAIERLEALSKPV